MQFVLLRQLVKSDFSEVVSPNDESVRGISVGRVGSADGTGWDFLWEKGSQSQSQRTVAHYFCLLWLGKEVYACVCKQVASKRHTNAINISEFRARKL